MVAREIVTLGPRMENGEYSVTMKVERCLNLGREKKAVFLVTSVDLGGVDPGIVTQVVASLCYSLGRIVTLGKMDTVLTVYIIQ